jgi:hypothetical protein
MFLRPGMSAELLGGPAGHHARRLEAFGVYVVQGDGGAV